jgi:hypothetical protein
MNMLFCSKIIFSSSRLGQQQQLILYLLHIQQVDKSVCLNSPSVQQDFEINIDVPDHLSDFESSSGFWPFVSVNGQWLKGK